MGTRQRSALLVPDIAPEIVHRRRIEAAAQPLEARRGRVHLGTLRGFDGGLITFDLAVVDVYVGRAHRDADAARADVAVGDMDLATIHGAHRVAIEHQVAVVDVQQPRTLAHDRLVAALEWR